jgi:UDP-MurNAc hydroxylase
MRITYLGHAGLKLETVASTVLCDPWFSPEGAYQASWFQFPDNSHIITFNIFRPKTIVISHEHLDHVDPWFLAQVPDDVPIIVPRYPSPALRRKIEAAGPREIIELDPWETRGLADGLSVFFVSEESPMNHDSAMVFIGDGQVLLNLNDARLSSAQFRSIRAKVGRPIDVFALQGSGASWFPMCYQYPEGRRKEISHRKRMAKLAYTARAIKTVKPTAVIPFAGPPCFLDPELAVFNEEMEDGIFPDQQQVADWLTRQGLKNAVVLLPGDVWDVTECAKVADSYWDGFSLANRQPYLEDYARRRRPQIEVVRARYPLPRESLWEPFRAYFERLLAMSPYFNRRISIRIGFEVAGPGGGSWSVDFRPGSEGVSPTIEDCAYKYRFESRWLPPLLDGSVPWEDFFLSLRFTAWRDPDVYNDHLLGLLKFAHSEALAAVEQFETGIDSGQWITIHSEGQMYRIQRQCPHAGLDLQDLGEVLPGKILRCLGHHYEFSLETGECLNGKCPALMRVPVIAT